MREFASSKHGDEWDEHPDQHANGKVHWLPAVQHVAMNTWGFEQLTFERSGWQVSVDERLAAMVDVTIRLPCGWSTCSQ
jgi:hypothetical protein